MINGNRKRIAQALLLACSVTSVGAGAKPPFHHVYYLFQQHPSNGCGDCYIPMVITRVPIDAKALAGGTIENILIITYERDSIFNISSDPVPLNSASVSLPERQLRWNNSRYRYQEVGKQEALRLLRNPLGSIPISRPGPTSPSELIRTLIDDLSTEP